MIRDELAPWLPELQAQAESLMVDTVLVERKSGTVLDPDTLREVDAWSVIYEGAGKVRTNALADRGAEAGDRKYDVATSTIDLPMSDARTGEIRNRDRATITASSNEANVGRSFILQRDSSRTWEVERRFTAEEVS